MTSFYLPTWLAGGLLYPRIKRLTASQDQTIQEMRDWLEEFGGIVSMFAVSLTDPTLAVAFKLQFSDHILSTEERA